MDISVVICTCDRLASLERVIASAAEMSVDGVAWELLIVDNGRGGEVEKVVDRYKARLPLRMEREPETGLSRARNCGVKSARGKYIVFTDDDVILDKGWLLAYSDAIRRRPDGVVFGGKIIPVLESPCTAWFRENIDLFTEVVSARDFGPAELPLSVADDRVPFGANYAVRAMEQRQFLYDVNVGPGTGIAGEEVAVIASILKSGRPGYWIPGAIVHHIISPSRQTTEYVVKRYKWQGAAFLPRTDERGALIKLAAKVTTVYMKYLVARALNLEPRWITLLKYYAYLRGGLESRLRNR
jgi:glycosyltransferase involved in cell wall biosynthesis